MIFKGDYFQLNGRTYLLLHCEAGMDRAWAIDVNAAKDWPREFIWSQIRTRAPYSRKSRTKEDDVKGVSTPSLSEERLKSSALKKRVATASMKKVRDRAMERLGDLIVPQISYPRIFDPEERSQMLRERAIVVKCTVGSLYTHLRRYWIGGQVKSALLANYAQCGSAKSTKTGSRGAKPESGRQIYQLEERDFELFRKIIERVYLKGNLYSMTAAHQKLLEDHYTYEDGNGDQYIKDVGERPTFRQFQHYLRRHIPLEHQLRSRKGDKEFEREDRPVLGTVMDICQSVGDIYEVDASILDIYLIASDDIKKIIGKPTIFLIMDRKSRLIVGWYVGLENASWIVAVEAFISISADKQEICKSLGVKYNPTDWPAHEIFPKQVLADRGEMLNKYSSQLSDLLAVLVSNLPSQRPEWKPIVETEFKQTRMILQPEAPGLDPPENAKKRQGKKYFKDASLTLKKIKKVILEAIIMHNRKPLLDYLLTPSEVGNDVPPIPTALWNHNIATNAGQLSKFDEETVRMALLPRDTASVTKEGILYKGCYYANPAAIAKGWFVTARNGGRFSVQIAFDRRSVDMIYVFDTSGSGQHYESRLTTRSSLYKGMSFGEAHAVQKILRLSNEGWAQTKTQVVADYHAVTNPVYEAARKNLKDAKLKTSRLSRRADTKAARAIELSKERHEGIASTKQASVAKNNVRSIVATLEKASPPTTDSNGAGTNDLLTRPMSAQEKLNQLKERMLRG